MKIQQCSLLFLLKSDQILLAMKKRGFGKGNWNGVGGKLEASENFEQAAIRECQEEIMVIPDSLSQVAEHTFIYNYQKPQTIEVQVFTSASWQGNPIETDEMAPRWFSQTDIPYAQMWVDDQFWLPHVFSRQICSRRVAF